MFLLNLSTVLYHLLLDFELELTTTTETQKLKWAH